jgi:hypothetical protein
MKRLFEDPETPAELRDDLLRSRIAASDYDAATQLTSLRAALLDTARDPLHGQSAHSAGGAKAGLSWHAIPSAWKLAALVAIGGGSALLVRSAQHAPAPPPSASSSVAPAVSAAPPPTLNATPAPTEPKPAEPEPAVEPASAPPSAADGALPSVSSSRREISQLVRIRALLKRDPAAAYRLARRSEQEFPHGVLSEERQAFAIVALAQSGDAHAAGKKAEDFFARYPHTPLRELVESALRH